MMRLSIYLTSTLICAAFLLAANASYSDRAKLYKIKSKYAGNANPTWYVSSYVRADIEERHLNGGSTTNSIMRRWVQTDVGCPSNDDAGHYIANSLGGNGRVYYNIFPENRTLNRGKQSQWEGKVYDYVASGDCDKARVSVRVKHKKSENPKTRPVRVTYRVRCVGGKIGSIKLQHCVTYRVRCVGRVEPGKKKSLSSKNWVNKNPAGC